MPHGRGQDIVDSLVLFDVPRINPGIGESLLPQLLVDTNPFQIVANTGRTERLASVGLTAIDFVQWNQKVVDVGYDIVHDRIDRFLTGLIFIAPGLQINAKLRIIVEFASIWG